MTQEALKLAFEKVTGIPDAWTNPALMQARNGFIQGWEAKEALAQTQEPVVYQCPRCATSMQVDLTAKAALAQTQEPVAWLEPEWGEKICPEVGYEVTMTDDHPRDLCWIPLYAHPPQGEPVAWQLWVGADTPLNAPMGWHFYSTYDSLKSAEVSARTINSYQQAPFAKVVPLYTAPPQRTWVGLTDEDICMFSMWLDDKSDVAVFTAIEAKLKELNT